MPRHCHQRGDSHLAPPASPNVRQRRLSELPGRPVVSAGAVPGTPHDARLRSVARQRALSSRTGPPAGGSLVDPPHEGCGETGPRVGVAGQRLGPFLRRLRHPQLRGKRPGGQGPNGSRRAIVSDPRGTQAGSFRRQGRVRAHVHDCLPPRLCHDLPHPGRILRDLCAVVPHRTADRRHEGTDSCRARGAVAPGPALCGLPRDPALPRGSLPVLLSVHRVRGNRGRTRQQGVRRAGEGRPGGDPRAGWIPQSPPRSGQAPVVLCQGPLVVGIPIGGGVPQGEHGPGQRVWSWKRPVCTMRMERNGTERKSQPRRL
mmetsp:Transcript_14281/g.39848  ORF Transcript_14281/g.39848 Transcript_14281/m.39848 type:complete len:315 (+) Transcript_14281:1940-2884(+)